METSHPLRKWRLNRQPKVTQTELAAAVGLTPSHISQIETREKGISLGRAVKIERFTNGEVPASALVVAERTEAQG